MKRFSRLYFRILLYFLSIVLFILLAGVFTYTGFIRGIENDFQLRIEENMRSVGNRIDEKIQSVFSMGTMLYNEESFTQYLRPYSIMTIQQKYGMKHIRESISRNKLMMIDTVQNIFAYIDEEKVYTDSSAESSESFFNDFHRYETYDRDFWMEWLHNRKQATILPADILRSGTPVQENIMLPVVMPSYNSGYRCVLVFNVSVERLYRMYYDSAVFESTVYIITDKNGVVASGDHRFNPELLTLGTENVFERSDYIIGVTSIERLGWKIYSFTPVKEITAVKRYYIIISSGVCLVLLLAGIFLSYVYSRKIYIPIRTASETLGTRHETANDGKRVNELDSIVVKVDEMVQSRSNVNDKLRQYFHRYVKQCMLNIIDQKPLEDAGYFEHILAGEIGFKEPCYLCICYVFVFKEAYYRDMGKNVVDNGIPEIAGVLNQIYEKSRTAVTMHYQKNMFVSVINLSESDEEALQSVIDDIFNTFRYDEDYCSIRIGIGGRVNGIYGISTSFEQACTALLSLPAEETNQVISYREVNIAKRSKLAFGEDVRLRNAVRIGEMKRLESTVKLLLEEHIYPGVEYLTAKSAVRSICEAVLAIAREERQPISNQDIAWEQEINFAAILLFSPGIDVRPLTDLFSRIFHMGDEPEKVMMHELSINAQRFVDANYRKELSLEIIADELGVSAKHLSRCFKSDTGMNLTDYIANVRVAKIKELLRGTMPISQIPEHVGISNRATFARMFKKVEGISLSEYRRYFRTIAEEEEPEEKVYKTS